MAKICFLDFDGVTNTEDHMNALYEQQKGNGLILRVRDEFGPEWCPIAVANITQLVRYTGAKIVVSSTWRASGMQRLRAMCKWRGYDFEFFDVTPLSKARHRGKEINEWLRMNAIHYDVNRYVILDDDDDMLPKQMPHFVHCTGTDGFNEQRLQQAISILNN